MLDEVEMKGERRNEGMLCLAVQFLPVGTKRVAECIIVVDDNVLCLVLSTILVLFVYLLGKQQ